MCSTGSPVKTVCGVGRGSCLSVMYVYQCSHCLFTEESGTLRGDGIFSLSHTDS